MRSSLGLGDEITTIGGITGKIVQVTEDTITFETGEDRVRLQVKKWAISTTAKMEAEEAYELLAQIAGLTGGKLVKYGETKREKEDVAVADATRRKYDATVSARHEYWKAFFAFADQDPEYLKVFRGGRKAPSDHWVDIGCGVSAGHISLTINVPAPIADTHKCQSVLILGSAVPFPVKAGFRDDLSGQGNIAIHTVICPITAVSGRVCEIQA